MNVRQAVRAFLLVSTIDEVLEEIKISRQRFDIERVRACQELAADMLLEKVEELEKEVAKTLS